MTPQTSQSFWGGGRVLAFSSVRAATSIFSRSAMRGSTAADTISGESQRCDAAGSAAETDQQQSYAQSRGPSS